MSKIERCAGINTGLGYVVGGGYSGKTDELDAVVQKEAEILQELYGRDVVVRFNSNRESGGAFIKDGAEDSSIGLTACIFNAKMRKMMRENALDFFNLPWKERVQLEDNPDSMEYSVNVDLTMTDNTCSTGKFVGNFCYNDFPTLDEAVEFLKQNVKGLKTDGKKD